MVAAPVTCKRCAKCERLGDFSNSQDLETDVCIQETKIRTNLHRLINGLDLSRSRFLKKHS